MCAAVLGIAVFTNALVMLALGFVCTHPEMVTVFTGLVLVWMGLRVAYPHNGVGLGLTVGWIAVSSLAF